MPPLPSVPSVARVKLSYTIGDDSSAGSRLFYKYGGGPPSAADLTAWAAAIFAGVSALQPSSSTQITYTGVTCQDLSSDTALEGAVLGAAGGEHAGPYVDAATCVTFRHLIARHYRGGKPKCFMPLGVASDLATEQSWLPASITTFQTAWDTFLASIVAGAPVGLATVSQVSVGYYQGSEAYDVGTGLYTRGKTHLLDRPGGPVVDPVTSSVAQVRPGSQRRRLGP